MNCLSTYRQDIRATSQKLFKELRQIELKGALNSDSVALNLVKQLLKCCDDVRDENLVEIGIQLEDMPEGPVWKKSTKEELLREKERKTQEEERRREQKMEAQRAQVSIFAVSRSLQSPIQAEAKAKKEAEIQIPPSEYFRSLKGDAYGSYDENGIPITNSDGSPVSKSQKEKMTKVGASMLDSVFHSEFIVGA